ncbi:MAG: AAA family ATPase, partial [Actinobacteria bacterium]|nr:AAA family ATPase [Actinomycetota bacterium]
MAGGVLCVMFTDLAGSTELMTRLGDVVFDELRSRHFADLRQAIAAGGGTDIKNTGDGLLATFTSAVQALAAATRIQQVTERQGLTSEIPLSVRVGLALGEVAVEDGDVYGTPVVEAARLVAAARPGQIVATAVVRIVAGTRAGVPFSDLGTMELKGLPDPVAVCEVGWEPDPATARTAVPLPGLLLRTGRIFVGRATELTYLRARWKEAAVDGRRSLVLLGGEPGVGKTRLAAGLAQELHEDGALVLGGRCDEDMGVPYQPFVEALRHYVTHTPAPLRLGRHAGELVRVIPELAGLVPNLPEPLRSDPETERYRLFEAVASWLAEVSAETPVLLVLDDLQWAAKPTLLLLRHVLLSSEAARLLIVATYRDTELPRGNPFAEFLSDLPRIEGTERLPVSGIDAADVAAYLEAAAGHDLDAQGLALAEQVWRETQGNCFFVSEVLRHLVESGAVEEQDGRWSTANGAVPIPEEVRDVIARRLARLPDPAGRVLACASVAGLEFDPAVVRAAGGFSEDDVLAGLDAAMAARLVVEVPGPVPRNRFAHALVRSTLYDDLSAARRQAMHRHMAETIEMIQLNHLDDYLSVLAHHWTQAGTNPAKAVGYASRAGQRALAQLAFDEAASFFGAALTLLGPDDPGRTELLISLGDAQRRAGEPAHRETLLEAARLAQAQGKGDALARAALANSRAGYTSRSATVDEERVATLEAALAATEEEDTPVRARLLATLGLELVAPAIAFTDLDRRVGMSDEALALARRIGEPATLAHVLLARFFTINAPSTVAERLANSAELLQLAAGLGDPAMSFLAAWQRARVLIEAGERRAAAASLDAAQALVGELGQPTFSWLAMWAQVGHLLLAARLEEAERLVDESYALGFATGQPDAFTLLVVTRFLLGFEQGRLPEIEPLVAESLRQFPAAVGLNVFLALVHSEAGRSDEARRALAPLAASGFELPLDTTWLPFLTLASEVVRTVGDTTAAATLYDLILPYVAVFSVVGGITTGCTAYHLGMLATMTGRFADAEEHFAYAAAAHDRMDAPAHLGRTRIEWARMRLPRRGPG